MNTAPPLVVTDLACARAGVAVLEGVSFAVASGQAMILRGPNGIGKTTLLRVVAGLQPPLAGQVMAAEVAYAAHADGVKAVLTVRENLAFWAQIYGTDAVAAAMEAMDLAGLAERRAAHLSAGQRRRLGLARLMVSGRALWVLDEPTVSLDAGSVALFAQGVAAHLAGGGAALIATHIALGLEGAAELDLTPYKARGGAGRPKGAFDEAFA